MKKNALWILVVFGILLADPAAAWFWEKNAAGIPASSAEVKKEQGFWAGVMETGRNIGRYFKRSGKKAKDDGKEVPGALKEEGKAVGKSIKGVPKTLGEEARQGGKAVKDGFKDLGRDIKESSESVFDGESEDPGK
ncbi:MAG: hypothetical protein RQ753_05560 [Desulfurivibrionaceae bacterium]|nr:hypothetical protein [Desulfurivibrionaceae bacterium]